MIELFGLIFGGVSRLAQHWMDLSDKQKERDHEARMFEQQTLLADKRFAHDSDMRQMDAASAEAQGEWAAMTAAAQAQADEAKAAGGWVAAFSALMRPLLTFWHCIAIYTAVKIALLMGAMMGGVTWNVALLSIYTDADRALCFSIISFWFADRSLRNWAKK